MHTDTVSIDAEPPLIRHLDRAAKAVKRTIWLYKKLAGPALYRFSHMGLAGVLLVSLNPFTSTHAFASTGPAAYAPELASFEFASYEEVSLEDELQQVEEVGFAPKPLVVATEMGRPEREERERQERLAREAEARRLAQAQAAARARNQNTRTARVAPQPVASPSTNVATSEVAPASSAGNTYAYGYCTWWVKIKRPDLPNQLGNAGAWLGSARRMGLATGSTPQAGSVVVTGEGPIGHVGYVEAVEGDEMIVSDMNMIGWNKVSKRRMSIHSGVIRGYIY